MNLIIDQGNTATKLHLFEGGKSVKKKVFSKEQCTETQQWITKYAKKVVAVLVSSVTSDKYEIDNQHTFVLGEFTPIPILNGYKTPKTLGRDRLANAVACWVKNPNKNSICIDIGTCIKYDLITAEGNYLGGNISPGINMRYKALHHFTDKLPLLTPKDIDFGFGTTTESSLNNGVQHAIFHEINGFIQHYTKEFSQLTIFMTGGDLKYFDKGDKNTIFAYPITVDEELTAFGLNEILTYNVKRT